MADHRDGVDPSAASGGTCRNPGALRAPIGGESDEVTLAFFYASWCGFCKRSLPGIQKLHENYTDKGVDVVVNFTGGDTWVPSLRVLHRGGRILTCGATAGFDPKEDLRFIWSYELKVLGANGWMREDLQTLIDMLSDGSLKPVIDKVLPLEEVNEAFSLLEDREVFGKVVVKP